MLVCQERDNIKWIFIIFFKFKAEKKNKWVLSRKAAEDYNKKLKEIMGADKFKQFNDIRKKQKEATQTQM